MQTVAEVNIKKMAEAQRAASEQGAKINPHPMGDTAYCARQSAMGVLDDIAYDLRTREEAYNILKRVIPWQLLSQHDEEVLYTFFQAVRRN